MLYLLLSKAAAVQSGQQVIIPIDMKPSFPDLQRTEFLANPIPEAQFSAAGPSTCPDGGCMQSQGEDISCDGGNCDQNFSKNSSCVGGNCAQKESSDVSCDGGSCAQINAIRPTCNGGKCDQYRAASASCDGGHCDQTKTTIYATCGRAGGPGRCDQRESDEVFCSFHCTQTGSDKAACEDHSCAQDNVKVSATCYGGNCDQTNAKGEVRCLGGYCNQKGAVGSLVSCVGGSCTACDEDTDCSNSFNCVDLLCVRKNCSSVAQALPGSAMMSNVSFSFICSQGETCVSGVCSGSTYAGMGAVALVLFVGTALL